MTARHLYVHVPFCVRRCGYCDFAVTAMRDPPVVAWLRCIEVELALRMAALRWTEPLQLDTIYIGGGTPSLPGPGMMQEVAAAISRCAVWDAGRTEWTAEANPESFAAELAADWYENGVNRVSFGVQTFHAPTLRWMGRMHGPDGAARAVAAARAAGIENISIDLIFGLPARLGRDWTADVSRVLELQPAHVSLYGLTAEPATPLGRRVAEGKEVLADDEQYATEFLEAARRLRGAGYRQYEVSNFAQPGRESRHNQAYWQHRPYLGLGPGAHSFVPPYRFWNVRDWAEYRSRLEAGSLPEAGRERLGAEELGLERIWLGLRIDDGIGIAELGAAQREMIQRWADAGWARVHDGRLRLTPAGWLLLDRLTVELAAAR